MSFVFFLSAFDGSEFFSLSVPCKSSDKTLELFKKSGWLRFMCPSSMSIRCLIISSVGFKLLTRRLRMTSRIFSCKGLNRMSSGKEISVRIFVSSSKTWRASCNEGASNLAICCLISMSKAFSETKSGSSKPSEFLIAVLISYLEQGETSCCSQSKNLISNVVERVQL